MSKNSDRLLSLQDREQLMFDLADIVRDTGKFVQGMKGDDIFDTVEVARHAFSSVDGWASNYFRGLVEARLKDRVRTVLEESEITRAVVERSDIEFPLLLADVIEGSTNAKRSLAARLKRPMMAGTSAVVLERDCLGSTAASAFYDYASGKVYSSFRAETNSFIAFKNRKAFDGRDHITTRGDSQTHVIVPGYSNGHIEERCRVERVLWDAGFHIWGGTRSSAQDLIEMPGNGCEAYVDLRLLFSKGVDDREGRDEVLNFWDVGGVLPVLDGLGIVIADASRLEQNQGWKGCSWKDGLALLVAKPSVATAIRDLIRQLPFVEEQPDDEAAVLFSKPTGTLGGS